MSGESNYTFDKLTQSGLFRINSKEDKQVSLSFDAFGGSTGFGIWTGGGAKPFKLPLPRMAMHRFVALLRKMRANPIAGREQIPLMQWDPETKRSNQVGMIVFSLDENQNLAIEISHKELNGRHTFPIRHNSKFDFSGTSLSPREDLESLFDWLISEMLMVSPVAERLSSFKRPPQGGGGRGNYGGGGNRGGYNNGGGNRGGGQSSFGNNGGGNNNSGGDDDLYV